MEVTLTSEAVSQRHHSFCLIHLNTWAQSPEPTCERSNNPEAAIQWENQSTWRGHIEVFQLAVMVFKSLSPGTRHAKETSLKMTPVPSHQVIFKLWIFPPRPQRSWSLYRATLHCVLLEFLTHWVHEQDNVELYLSPLILENCIKKSQPVCSGKWFYSGYFIFLLFVFFA